MYYVGSQECHADGRRREKAGLTIPPMHETRFVRHHTANSAAFPSNLPADVESILAGIGAAPQRRNAWKPTSCRIYLCTQNDTARTLLHEIDHPTARSGLHHARCQRRDIVFECHCIGSLRKTERSGSEAPNPRGEAWKSPFHGVPVEMSAHKQMTTGLIGHGRRRTGEARHKAPSVWLSPTSRAKTTGTMGYCWTPRTFFFCDKHAPSRSTRDGEPRSGQDVTCRCSGAFLRIKTRRTVDMAKNRPPSRV